MSTRNRLLHLDRTLEQVEGGPAPDPSAATSPLGNRVGALRKKQLRDLTVEDLRVLVGQSVGLPFVLPLAMEVLRADPLAEAKFYAGDLLSVVMLREPAAWTVFPDLADELTALVSGLLADAPPELEGHLKAEAERFLAARAGA